VPYFQGHDGAGAEEAWTSYEAADCLVVLVARWASDEGLGIFVVADGVVELAEFVLRDVRRVGGKDVDGECRGSLGCRKVAREEVVLQDPKGVLRAGRI